METRITLELTSAVEQALDELVHQLKHIHDTEALLVQPEDDDAPILLCLSSSYSLSSQRTRVSTYSSVTSYAIS